MDSIYVLIIGCCDKFEKDIPNTARHLKVECRHNKEVQHITIPNFITQLEFSDQFYQSVVVPNSVEYLKFGSCFNKPIELPASVKYLILSRYFDQELELNSLMHINENMCENPLRFFSKIFNFHNDVEPE